jgi:hypothetical protein
MGFIQNIFQTQKGLDNPDNYHQFCRLLARLKTNFQLSELVSVDGWVHTNLRGGLLPVLLAWLELVLAVRWPVPFGGLCLSGICVLR